MFPEGHHVVSVYNQDGLIRGIGPSAQIEGTSPCIEQPTNSWA